jgi:Glycosyl hydrolase catalytic core
MTGGGRSRRPVCAVLVVGALAAPLVASPARAASSPAADRAAPRILGPERQRIAVDDTGCGTLRALVVRRGKARGPIVVRVRSARGRAGIEPRTVRVRPGRAFRIRVRLNARLQALLRRERVVHRKLHVVADPRRGRSASRTLRARFDLRAGARHPGALVSGDVPPPPGSRYRGIVPGMSEQGTAMFADPRFRALCIPAARFVAPWDAIDTDVARLDAWLGAAAWAGVEPLMVFNRARGSRCPDQPCELPDVAAYEAAVRRFLARYPWVHVITPWNEPNHQAEPTSRNAEAAAAYYGAVRRACPACTIVAGDVLDTDNMLRWLAAYQAALPEKPAVWGLHNYHDTTHRLADGLESFLHAVAGEVWLTETGGIVQLRNSSGRVTHPYDEQRAANGVRQAFALARAHAARVRRVYVYNWQDDPNGYFTAGLLDASGRERPGFFVFRDELALLIAQPRARR